MFLLQVTKNQIKVVQTEPMTSGSQNVYPIQFEFSDEWSYLERVAVFSTNVGPNGPVEEPVYNQLLNEDNRCFIPWEVNKIHNKHVFVGVFGTMNGDVVLPTIWIDIGNVLLGVTTGLELEPPTPTLYEQILGEIGEIKEGISSIQRGTNLLTVNETNVTNLSDILNETLPRSALLINSSIGITPGDARSVMSVWFNSDVVYLRHRDDPDKPPAVVLTDMLGRTYAFVYDSDKNIVAIEYVEPELPKGEDGKSAYDIAVENGFEGTEAEWVESLKGRDGVDGSNGKDGADGFSPTVDVTAIDNGHRVTITDKDGPESFDVMNGKDGVGGSGDGTTAYLVKAPVGTIVIWSGTTDNVPENWAICDGQDGRPDLRDKFVLGAGDSHAVGETGGAEEVTLTVAQIPKHSHRYIRHINTTPVTSNGTINAALSDSSYGATDYTGGSNPHNNMPPYYSLCYIIKTAPDETDPSPAATSQEINAPIGAIMAWSKSADEIPQGWHICDGTEGTVDLQDKFVLGAGGKYNPNATGGAEEVTLTVDQMPSHSHDYTAVKTKIYCNESSATKQVFWSSQTTRTGGTGSSQPHPNMPPYRALIFIQKTSVTPTDYVTEERVDEKISEAVTTSTIDGWTVRKHSDGYVEMFHKATVVKTADNYTLSGSCYIIDNATSSITLPLTLKTCYECAFSLSTNTNIGNYGAWLMPSRNNSPTTHIPYVAIIRPTKPPAGTYTYDIYCRVCGLWK